MLLCLSSRPQLVARFGHRARAVSSGPTKGRSDYHARGWLPSPACPPYQHDEGARLPTSAQPCRATS
eukprot:1952477-Rhodomonas_salina.2